MIVAVVLAPLAAALAPLLVGSILVRRYLRIALAGGAAIAPLAAIGSVDALSLVFAALVSVLSALGVAFSVGRALFAGTRRDVVRGSPAEAVWSRVSVYFVLLGAFWSAMLTVVLATSFTWLWLGISATTLATAFLVAFGGERAALEAAWKYLILCSIGLAFALLGIVVLGRVALASGLDPSHALAWDAVRALAPQQAPLARLAVALMLVGFGTKAGLVPMHAWLPDAHSKAPAPVSGMLSGVLVSCSLYAIVRTLSIAPVFGADEFARAIVLWLGVLSVVVAGALMLAQRDIKRLLAYSTVEHAGIVALALGFGGPFGDFAAVLHVVAHGATKAAAFFAVGLVQSETGTTEIGRWSGLWRTGRPGRLLLGALAGLAGLPPFGIFATELFVLVAGAMAGRWSALACALVGLAFAFAALVRTAVEIESGPPIAVMRRRPWLGPAAASGGACGLALAGAAASVVLPWSGLVPHLRAVLAGHAP